MSGPVWTDPSECAVGAGLLFEGSWSGYAQGEGHDYDFTLELGGSDSSPCGTVTFGEPATYAPATSVEVPSPTNNGAFKHIERAPGFTYKLLDVEVEGPRVR